MICICNGGALVVVESEQAAAGMRTCKCGGVEVGGEALPVVAEMSTCSGEA